MGLCALGGVGDQTDQLLEPGAAVLCQFAAQQVQRLNAVGAFVDRVQAVVTVVLLHRVLTGITVTTEDLDRQFVGLQAELRRPGFDDRRQQIQQLMGLLAFGFGLQRRGVIEQPRRVQPEVERAFDVSLLRQQHALTSAC